MGDRLATCRTSQGAARQAAAGKAPAMPHHHPLLGCGVGRGTADLWRVRCGIQKVHDGHVCLAVELFVWKSSWAQWAAIRIGDGRGREGRKSCALEGQDRRGTRARDAAKFEFCAR